MFVHHKNIANKAQSHLFLWAMTRTALTTRKISTSENHNFIVLLGVFLEKTKHQNVMRLRHPMLTQCLVLTIFQSFTQVSNMTHYSRGLFDRWPIIINDILIKTTLISTDRTKRMWQKFTGAHRSIAHSIQAF